MDHMMPEMDGIEATAAIRALGSDVPIIALTANAISGMKEMFLSKGFNDYLAKPIEMSKLDEIMVRWIPKEKNVRNERPAEGSAGGMHGGTEKPQTTAYSALVNIGVDVAKGIRMTGGAETAYRKVLRSFGNDAMYRLPLFAAMPCKESLSDFAIHAHALKSAAATIGAASVSAQAAELEAAGKAGDLETIEKGLASFYGDLKNLAEQIEKTLAAEEGGPAATNLGESMPLFTELSSALEEEDIAAIRRILAELEERPFDSATKGILSDISNAVMMSEFEDAVKKVKSILQAVSRERAGESN
jgi:CheY-like chemotaxis protein